MNWFQAQDTCNTVAKNTMPFTSGSLATFYDDRDRQLLHYMLLANCQPPSAEDRWWIGLRAVIPNAVLADYCWFVNSTTPGSPYFLGPPQEWVDLGEAGNFANSDSCVYMKPNGGISNNPCNNISVTDWSNITGFICETNSSVLFLLR